MFGIHTRTQSQVHKCSHWLPCLCPVLTAHTDPNGLSPRQIKSDSDDDDLPNVTLDSVNETGSTALSIARAVQEWVSWSVCLGNVDPLYWLFLLCWPQHVLKKKEKSMYLCLELCPARKMFWRVCHNLYTLHCCLLLVYMGILSVGES